MVQAVGFSECFGSDYGKRGRDCKCGIGVANSPRGAFKKPQISARQYEEAHFLRTRSSKPPYGLVARQPLTGRASTPCAPRTPRECRHTRTLASPGGAHGVLAGSENTQATAPFAKADGSRLPKQPGFGSFAS